jgi:hypothetical protein
MSWTFSGIGKPETTGIPPGVAQTQDNALLATETIAMGAAKANRYSSVIDWIPIGTPFTVISNTGATNLSGSASDQLYACQTRGGTYLQVKDTLRDCNYAHDKDQGTSFRSIDAARRVRFVDPSYVGPFSYWKIRILQAAVESSAKTVGLAVIVGAPEEKLQNWKNVITN